jgi:hypothetical protein
MLNAARRLARLAAAFTRKKPALTKETALSAFDKSSYSNEKVKKALGYEFISVEKCIEDCCLIYANEPF